MYMYTSVYQLDMCLDVHEVENYGNTTQKPQ